MRSEKLRGAQVEGCAGLVAADPLAFCGSGIGVQGGQVMNRQCQGGRSPDDLVDLIGVHHKARAQNFVAGDQQIEGALNGRGVQRT